MQIIHRTKAIGQKYFIEANLFNIKYYVAQCPGVTPNSASVVAHYYKSGWKLGVNPFAFFDTKFYLEENKDITQSGMNPLEHYFRYGYKEGRNPSPFFDTRYYLKANKDVNECGMNPLEHFIVYGWKEHRKPSDDINISQIFKVFTFLKNDGIEGIEDYLINRNDSNWISQHVPSVLLDGESELFVSMSYGGGTGVYDRNYIDIVSKKHNIIYARYLHLSNSIRITVYLDGLTAKEYDFFETSHFFYAIKDVCFSKITINHLITWPSTEEILSFVEKYKDAHQNVTVDMKCHDFYSVCPSYCLMDSSGIYCGVRSDESECKLCIKDSDASHVYRDKNVKEDFSVTEWRKMWKTFFMEYVDTIHVISDAYRKVFAKAYADKSIVSKIRLVPHKVLDFGVCRVGILGHISVQKGASVVRDLCCYLDNNQIDDMQLFMFGENKLDITSPRLKQMGSYLRGYLPDILKKNRIDIIFIPSVIPESFCYTAGEGLSLGYPVACFDIGGQADQVRAHERGVILSQKNPSYIYDVLKKFKSECSVVPADCTSKTILETKAVVIQDKSQTDYLKYLFAMRDDKSEYVTESDDCIKMIDNIPKLIAFYLPQYHDFDENIRWFGRGFTEWTNTSRTLPQYIGHVQPQVPIDVGYYNLGSTAVMHRQVELARKYGIYGFAFYYYWFSGKKIMEKPLQMLLNDKDVDFPFFFFWANEDWTRLWGDGGACETLYKCELKPGDAEKFMADALPYMKDSRYIKINDKPVLIIYKLKKFPEDSYMLFVDEIRDIARKNGFPGLYISGIIEEWMNNAELADIQEKYRLDALTEFSSMFGREFIQKSQTFVDPGCRSVCYDVDEYVSSRRFLRDTDANVLAGLFTNWDNSPRRYNRGASILQNTPENYKQWLSELIRWTNNHHNENERFIFVNAWNEWAECAHLEPDTHYGYAYLQKTREALEESIAVHAGETPDA